MSNNCYSFTFLSILCTISCSDSSIIYYIYIYIDIYIQSISGPSTLFYWFIYLFLSEPCLNYFNFIISQYPEGQIPSILFFFLFQEYFSQSQTIDLLYKYQKQVASSTKYTVRIFIAILLNRWNILERLLSLQYCLFPSTNVVYLSMQVLNIFKMCLNKILQNFCQIYYEPPYLFLLF